MDKTRSLIKLSLSSKTLSLGELTVAAQDMKSKISNIKNISDNIRYGKMEYKIKINSYGESLGLSEGSVAKLLSEYFLQSRKSTTNRHLNRFWTNLGNSFKPHISTNSVCYG